MRRMMWPLVGVLALVGGLIWARSAPEPGASSGWFAYTPLASDSPGVFIDLLLVSRAQLAGLLVAALGVLVLTGWIGFRVGRRGSRGPGGR